MSSRRRALTLVAVAVLLAGGWRRFAGPSSQNPLVGRLLPQAQRVTFEGTVEETLRAGGYDYLRITPTVGAARWVATLHDAARPQQVQVQVFARAEHFESRRLSRTFAPLEFGQVDPAPSIVHPPVVP